MVLCQYLTKPLLYGNKYLGGTTMTGTRSPNIGWAMLARPQRPGQPPGNTILLLIFQHPGSTLLPESLLVDMHFVEGMGCEVWRETRRDQPACGVTTVTLEPSRLPSLAHALLQTGTNLENIEWIVVRAGNDACIELHARPYDLRYHPDNPQAP